MSERGRPFEYDADDGVLRMARPGMRWLAPGLGGAGGGRRSEPGGGTESGDETRRESRLGRGGFLRADAAYNVTVPEGFERVDLDAYARERRRAAGFEGAGPTLFTGVAQEHARAARAGPVEVVATAGLSNPAALPMDPQGDRAEGGGGAQEPRGPGTVNVVGGTVHALPDGALAGLVGVVAEAKAATLLAETGFPGTTTDAIVVGCDPAGEPEPFAGSATAVGGAARACVRDAVRASLEARYGRGSPPAAVGEARHGLATDRRAAVFRPG